MDGPARRRASLPGRDLGAARGLVARDLPRQGVRPPRAGAPLDEARRLDPGRRGGPREHHDLKDLLTDGGAAVAAPLDLYAKLVGLPGKESVAGEDVQSLYSAGAHHEIAAYCMTDVVQTWLLFLRWRLVEGSLSVDGYEESVASARAMLPALFARRLPAEQRGILDKFLARCRGFLGAAREPGEARKAS